MRCSRVLVLLGLLIFTSSAGAVEGEDAARRAWKVGQQAFEQGEYGKALKSFHQGYKLSKKGGFLFNMAECARMMEGQQERAYKLYRSYLLRHSTGGHVEEARSRCASLALGPCTPAPPAQKRRGAVVPSPAPATPGSAASRASTVERVDRSMAREDQEQARSAASAPAPFLPSPRQDLQVTKQGTPFYKHWALWVGIGAVLAGTATAIAVSQAGGSSAAPSGEYVLDFR